MREITKLITKNEALIAGNIQNCLIGDILDKIKVFKFSKR